MQHSYFTGMVKQFETARIKAYVGQKCSAMEKIPTAFGLLLHEIIGIMHKNIDRLCRMSEGVALMGLQPASMMIQSGLPKEKLRYLNDKDVQEHFCCTLDYIVCPKTELQQPTLWEQTHSVIIDFTSGKVMNSIAYMAQLNLTEQDGIVYGHINEDTIDTAWRIAKLKSSSATLIEVGEQFHVGSEKDDTAVA